MKMFKKIKKIWIVVAGIVILLIGGFFVFNKNGKNGLLIEQVKRMNIYEEVKATGKVVPEDRISLAFEKGGTVSAVYVKSGDSIKKGQILGSLDSRELLTNLSGAEANLMSEQAKLIELKKGTRSEELSIYEDKSKSAEVSLNNALNNLIGSSRDAYTKIDDAMKNYADVVFDNGQSINPEITISVGIDSAEKKINADRYAITQRLRKWANLFSSANSDPLVIIKDSEEYISFTKSFLQSLAKIVDDSGGTSGLSESTLSSYKEDISFAQTQVNTASLAFTSASSDFLNAKSALGVANAEFNLKKSGTTPEAITAQVAKVNSAMATAENYRVQVSKSSIYSPIDGTVSESNPDKGEYFNAGEKAFEIISQNNFKVEVQVPEVDIAKISVGDQSYVTLDSYGDDTVFLGRVNLIDPAETFFEGVPSYKVTIGFETLDARILPGMTANVRIVSNQKDNVLVIPSKAIFRKDGDNFVKILNGQEKNEVKITKGISSPDGLTEILSGLNDGDRIVIE